MREVLEGVPLNQCVGRASGVGCMLAGVMNADLCMLKDMVMLLFT
jgi:hypothetical protein